MNKKIFSVLLGFAGISPAFPAGPTLWGNGDIVTVERSVPAEFKSIALDINATLRVYQSKDIKLSITVDSNLEEYIQTDVEDSILKIKEQKGVSLEPKKGIIDVYMPNIKSMELSSIGHIIFMNNVQAESLRLALLGIGSIKGSVDCKDFAAAIEGCGDITIKGKCQNAQLVIEGSGNFKCAEFEASDVKISISGVGDVRIDAKSTLAARISGSGAVRYKGSPQKIPFENSGDGALSH